MTHTPQILVISQSERFTKHVEQAVAEHPAHVHLGMLGPCLDTLPTQSPSPALVIVDVLLPHLGACQVVQQAQQRWPSSTILLAAPPPLLPAHEGSASGVLSGAITTALLATQMSIADFLGISPSTKEIAEALPRLASVSTSSILLRGERGVGKSLLAHQLHQGGKQHDQLFVRLCCALIPPELLQRLLFGHVQSNKTLLRGLLEVVTGGVIYLDDVSVLEASTKARLLRATEQRQFKHVGGTHDLPLSSTVIGATTRLRQRRAAHDLSNFDLHAIVELRVPPLHRDSPEIERLVHHLLRSNLLAPSGSDRRPSMEALEALRTYPWPGNRRELYQIITRVAAHRSGSTIELCDLPPLVRFHASASPPHHAAHRRRSGQQPRPSTTLRFPTAARGDKD